jgi:cytochrome c553
MILIPTMLMPWMAHAATTKPRLPAAIAAKVAAQPQGDPLLGKDKAESERCAECHGIEGQGQPAEHGPEMKFPKLAGLTPAYIVQQVEAFRSGARKNDQMTIMARAVSDEDLIDIAAYFGNLNGRPQATP